MVYARTVLRNEVDDVGSLVPGLLAQGLDIDMLVTHPQRSAELIAAHLTRRDRLTDCTPDLVQAAARAMQLACPTEVLLTRGGDHRQQVDWTTGHNSYGMPVRPNPWRASFSSCTASAPTFRAFDTADVTRLDLARAALGDELDETARSEADSTRALLLSALNVRDTDVEVVLTPSGTDAELVALAVALAGGGPVTSILMGPAELGRGTPRAAAGRHFSDTTPSGAAVTPGEPIGGFASELVDVAPIAIRDAAGNPVPTAAITRAVDAAIEATDARVLLHVVEGSKTGIRTPPADVVAEWEATHGDRIDVVVDAAQMRIDQTTAATHLTAGRMLIVTGSKFFGGPPFSGAVLIPRHLADRLAGDREVPHGLGDYVARAEVPDRLVGLAAAARSEVNLGLLLRWSAALAEMRAFHNVSPVIRDEVVRRLGHGITEAIDNAPYVRLVESPYVEPSNPGHHDFDELPTIFTFTIEHPDGTAATIDEVRAFHKDLASESSDHGGQSATAATPAGRSYLLGQPVTLRAGVAGLRIAIGAAEVSRVVFDHTRGATWRDRLAAEVAEARDALDALATLITARSRKSVATTPVVR